MNKAIAFALLPVAALALSACTVSPSAAEYDKATADIIKNSFQDRGIAKVDRLVQDDANRECAAADVAGKTIDPTVAKAIEAANMKTVKWPSDGKFLGDWKEGEKIAQSGRGLTWTDKAGDANGGNCYNCHQIDPKEISYGTIGPSLYQYGKNRGVADVNAPTARPILEYTWTKLYNAKAYNACSGMPRFGHAGLLDEKQMRDLMALILDPQSPVNR